jgi:hypothetical protein
MKNRVDYRFEQVSPPKSEEFPLVTLTRLVFWRIPKTKNT